MKTYKIRVPKRFFNDHCDRDCVRGEYPTEDGVTKITKTHYYVELNEEDAIDLLDDAYHYDDPSWIQEDRWYFGLVQSAKATKIAVAKALAEQGYQFTEKQISKYGINRILAS